MDCVEFQNHIQAQFSIKKATAIIRDVFIKSWKQNFGHQWQDIEDFGKYFKENPACIKIYADVGKHQKKLLLEANSENWDISLLNKIFNFPPFNSSKYTHPIQMLANLRNKVSHNSKMKMEITDLKEFRKKYTEAMMMLGCNKDDLNKTWDESVKKGLVVEKTIENNVEWQLIKKKGNEKFVACDYKEAIKLYNSAIILDDISDQDLAVLYSNRSLSYLKLHNCIKSNDERNLLRALNDANRVIDLHPSWAKGNLFIFLHK